MFYYYNSGAKLEASGDILFFGGFDSFTTCSGWIFSHAQIGKSLFKYKFFSNYKFFCVKQFYKQYVSNGYQCVNQNDLEPRAAKKPPYIKIIKKVVNLTVFQKEKK